MKSGRRFACHKAAGDSRSAPPAFPALFTLRWAGTINPAVRGSLRLSDELAAAESPPPSSLGGIYVNKTLGEL